MLKLSPGQVLFEYLLIFQSPYFENVYVPLPWNIIFVWCRGLYVRFHTRWKIVWNTRQKWEKRASKVKMRAGKACKKTWGVRIGCVDEFILGFRWSLMKIGLSQFKGLLWPSRPLEPLFVQGLLQQNSFQVLPFPRPPPPYLFPHLHLGN